jgi:hypothetical protein
MSASLPELDEPAMLNLTDVGPAGTASVHVCCDPALPARRC